MLGTQHYLCPGRLFCGFNRGVANVGLSLFLYQKQRFEPLLSTYFAKSSDMDIVALSDQYIGFP